MPQQSSAVLKKLSTGIHGFDQIANGGLPEGRSTLIAGTAGSSKTLLVTE
jgi:circadian clock protein KaiC